MQQECCEDWHLNFIEPVQSPLDGRVREYILERLGYLPLDVDWLKLMQKFDHSLRLREGIV